MARRAKNPDAELAALHDKRVGLATKRATIEDSERVTLRVIEDAPERRRAVLVAEARAEEPTETLELVNRESRAAEVAVAEGRERAAALKAVEQEIGQEVEAVIDAYPAHFIAAAEAASEAAAEAIATAKAAAQAAATAWRDAQGAWGTVRLSRRRRGLEAPPEVPISDFGNAVGELAKSHSRPFPGGSREAWERFRTRDGQQVQRLSNREAIATFGGEAA
jgi:hypothetical protein